MGYGHWSYPIGMFEHIRTCFLVLVDQLCYGVDHLWCRYGPAMDTASAATVRLASRI